MTAAVREWDLKAELIERYGLRKTRTQTESVIYEWISWYNQALAPHLHLRSPPAEYEINYYTQINTLTRDGARQPSLPPAPGVAQYDDWRACPDDHPMRDRSPTGPRATSPRYLHACLRCWIDLARKTCHWKTTRA